MNKVRADILLVQLGLAESRAQAQHLIMAGLVRAGGQIVLKPGMSIPADSHLEVDQGPRFVSRGGEKLEAALSTFSLDVSGLTCADVGASTGGFTDCLLQHGARIVYAIDVGQGILHWKLRQDPRVVVMERTNARHVERLSEPVHVVTVDASFISLKILLPVITGWFSPLPFESDGDKGVRKDGFSGETVALIKPQFEAGRLAVAHGQGVIRDPAIHRQVLQDTLAFAQKAGYSVRGLTRSPLLGPKGNTEFLVWLGWPGTPGADIEAMVAATLPY